MVGRVEVVFECPCLSKTGEGKGKEVLGDKEVGALFSEILAPLSILTSAPQVQTMIRISQDRKQRLCFYSIFPILTFL